MEALLLDLNAGKQLRTVNTDDRSEARGAGVVIENVNKSPSRSLHDVVEVDEPSKSIQRVSSDDISAVRGGGNGIANGVSTLSDSPSTLLKDVAEDNGSPTSVRVIDVAATRTSRMQRSTSLHLSNGSLATSGRHQQLRWAQARERYSAFEGNAAWLEPVDAPEAETKVANDVEARESQRLEKRLHKQHLMQMMRNIPFIECTIAKTSIAQINGRRHVLYHIDLAVRGDNFRQASHMVSHRFSEFLKLHEAITKEWGKHMKSPLEFPAKKWFSLSEAEVETRRVKLEQYMQQLLHSLNWSINPEIRDFIEGDLWLKTRRRKEILSS